MLDACRRGPPPSPGQGAAARVAMISCRDSSPHREPYFQHTFPFRSHDGDPCAGPVVKAMPLPERYPGTRPRHRFAFNAEGCTATIGNGSDSGLARPRSWTDAERPRQTGEETRRLIRTRAIEDELVEDRSRHISAAASSAISSGSSDTINLVWARSALSSASRSISIGSSTPSFSSGSAQGRPTTCTHRAPSRGLDRTRP